jgi:RimJ/RimL family protein N-acetyltransferase
MPLMTDRLEIRPLRPGDGPAFSVAIEESRSELAEYLDWAATAPTGTAAEAYARRRGLAFEQRLELPLYTFDRATGGLVGECGLYGIDWFVPKFGLGYWCRNARRGEGLTTEAVAAVVEWAFQSLGARRVELGCFESNVGSKRIAEKCGFEFEGIFRLGRRRPGGEPEDRLNFAITR